MGELWKLVDALDNSLWITRNGFMTPGPNGTSLT